MKFCPRTCLSVQFAYKSTKIFGYPTNRLWHCNRFRTLKKKKTIKHFCFLFYFIYFNWRTITLQYYDGFAIHRHEPATGIHVSLPPGLPSHLLLSLSLSQSTGFVTSTPHPALCFTYGNVYALMLFSQITPPSPTIHGQAGKETQTPENRHLDSSRRTFIISQCSSTSYLTTVFHTSFWTSRAT